MKRLVGEFVIEDREIFCCTTNESEKKLIEKYEAQVKLNPNHP